jgi:hypothetical protein
MALAPYLPLVQAPELITLKFRIQFAATTGDPDFQVPANSIATATADTGGVYSLTLNEKYPVFVGGFGSYMAADGTADAYVVNILPSGYDSDTGVLTVTLFTDDGDGTYTAENGIDNDWLYLELTFCRRSTLCPSGAIA